ncbi:hypothetical protein [Paenibacillus sp. FJAT-27812]|uniref:hypothetical protein n=1 Tax=Paenibacillus sp. FJAT-27812 TaxID=1684143 RepID=UPI0018D05F6C|nr:hypothetical protein [Paenibacillus sp. FJAT-27812]
MENRGNSNIVLATMIYEFTMMFLNIDSERRYKLLFGESQTALRVWRSSYGTTEEI